ncbi:hypothetical protein ACMD2_19594 [Ananas comosus]|uniref:BRO1 domain-containing protein n=1 Tax=Ananas comosus TaxID=4615 RepID=A0A199W3U1_ANACO|nr:hypothetical protein ACMD2_19594 [Ananas comosus]
MGCFVSTQKDAGGVRRRPSNIGEVAVFFPGLRIPRGVEISQPLSDSLPRSLVERLAALRTRIVVMAAQEAPTLTKARRKAATQHGGSTAADLLQALEDYLPVLLGLVKDGSKLEDKLQFVWVNQEDEAEETAMSNAWYEILSVLHLMAILCFSEANLLLLPKTSSDGYQPKVSEGYALLCITLMPPLIAICYFASENRRASIDIFLKAAGYLDCAIRHVLPRIPPELRKDLPIDLTEGVLKAFRMQALGQLLGSTAQYLMSIDIQLGLAIDSPKATLAVKRRLACEMVKCWQQAQDSIADLSLPDGWGRKHRLFVQWKCCEAKAAAYYYHGLILDEGNTEKSHGMAVAALQAAEEFLKESKRASEAFNATAPLSRSVPLWGSMKYLSEKIPKDSCSKVRINKDLYSNNER